MENAALSQTKHPEAPSARRILPYLVMMTFCVCLATDMYMPSLPAIVKDLHTTRSAVQLTVSLYLLGFAFGPLFYGPLSDRFGRKPIAFLGMSIGLLSSIACYFAPTIDVLLIGRFVQGIGATAGVTLARTIARDTAKGDKLAHITSYLSLFFSIGPAVAPLIGGYIETYLNWRFNFVVLSVYFAVVLFIVIFLLPETRRNKDRDATRIATIMRNNKKILSCKTFLAHVLVGGTSLGCIMVYFTVSPFLLQDHLGVSPMMYGYLCGFITLGAIAARYSNTLIIKRIGYTNTLVVGLLFLVAGSVLMTLLGVIGLTSVSAVVSSMLIVIIGTGLVFSNATTGAITPFGHIAGTATAMYGSVQVLFAYTASMLSIHLPHGSQTGLGLLLTTMTVTATIVYYLIYYRAFRREARLSV